MRSLKLCQMCFLRRSALLASLLLVVAPLHADDPTLTGGPVAMPEARPAGELRERTPLAKIDLPIRPAYPTRLIVKFVDEVRARASAEDGALRLDGGVRELAALAVARDPAVHFAPLIDLPQERLDALERRAADRQGVRPADLAGMLIVEAPATRIEAIAAALWASPLVEFVHWQELAPPPPWAGCIDAAPLTPSYQSAQGYLGANPGLNMLAAWALPGAAPGARGEGVKIADCEYWFNDSHEDLCGIIPEAGQVPHPNIFTNNWHQHGTAVLGQLVGGDNGYGVTGLVPQSTAYFFPEWTVQGGFRRVTAIANAIATVDAGDVVLLEMQTNGAGGGYGPAELDPSVWIVVKTGTDAGVIVVAAAGNGNQNLNSAPYAPYMAWGHSGAIIVGAGSANSNHNKLGFSTHGSRVDLQGWGHAVASTGYGSYATIGGDPNQTYTNSFSGTSSASPMVAAAVAAVQGVHRQLHGTSLGHAAIRQLLVDTGHPQGGTGGNIGQFPDIAAAIGILLSGATPSGCDDAQPIGDGVMVFSNDMPINGGVAEPLCIPLGGDLVEAERWFVYEATCTGTLSVSACVGVVTRVGLYGAECPTASGEALVCDLNSCPIQQRPLLTLAVTTGDRLHLRVGSQLPQPPADSVIILACVGALAADLNGDGLVDGLDLGMLLQMWGTADPGCDLNDDGVINGLDLGLLLNSWS